MVARFLALLELYREGSVSFEQITPLGELYVTWTPAGHQPPGAEPDAPEASAQEGSE